LNTATASEVPAVEFVPIIQVDRCKDGCVLENNIASILNFCSDQTCVENKDTPYFTLFRVFYMIHKIDDPEFA
jgi:hypothetical protein